MQRASIKTVVIPLTSFFLISYRIFAVNYRKYSLIRERKKNKPYLLLILKSSILFSF